MLSIGKVHAGGQADYYLACSEHNEVRQAGPSGYYLSGHEPAGVWWAGDNRLAQTGELVSDEAFQALTQGYDQDGNALARNAGEEGRQAGWDLTFSADKSVSAAWAVAGDRERQALEVAHHEAVHEALSLLNDHAAFTRRGAGGRELEPVNITAATFQHSANRNGDPQLHTHAVVMNVAERADGTTGTLEPRALYQWKMAAGAHYRAALADALEQRGFETALRHDAEDRPYVELKGVPEGATDAWSSRREDIAELAEQRGFEPGEDPERAAAVARDSRIGKNESTETRAEMRARWHREAQVHGLTAERVEGLRADRPRDRAADRREAALDAIERIPETLSETRSVFSEKDVARAAAEHGAGVLSPAEIRAKTAELQGDGRLIAVGADVRGERYTTNEMVTTERRVQQRARELAAEQRHGLGAASVERHVAQAHERMRAQGQALSQEQEAAIRHGAGPESVAVIEGSAGSGKSSVLRPIADAYRGQGYQVRALATAWRQAGELGRDLEAPAHASEQLLRSVEAGRTQLTGRDVLVVDEYSQVDARQMNRLLKVTQDAGAKVVFTGDRHQHQPVGAGPGGRLVADQVGTVRIDRIARQRDPEQRQAVADLRDRRTERGIATFERAGSIHYAADRQAQLAEVVRRHDEHRRHSDSVAVLARTRSDVNALNETIRARRMQNGEVAAEGARLEVAGQRPGRPREIELAAGDRLRFGTRDDQLGVVNGTLGTVAAVRGQGADTQLAVQLDTGRAVAFRAGDHRDRNGEVALRHAYAMTTYEAQGVTVDRAVYLADPASMDRHEAYVAFSRHREHVDGVFNAGAIRERVADQDPNTSVQRVTDPQVRQQVVHAAAREPESDSALDALNQAHRERLGRVATWRAEAVRHAATEDASAHQQQAEVFTQGHHTASTATQAGEHQAERSTLRTALGVVPKP